MSEMNFDVARFNMIEQQIRTWEVLDPHVLELLNRVPREEFVPLKYRKVAFADMNIPLGRSQVMLAPKLEARLVQELKIQPTDKILEVGTGSGHMTALLASMGGHVYSVEIMPEFKLQAAERLAKMGITNVTLDVGDASRGWKRHQPYDAIVVTGSLPMLPDAFRRCLALNGRMIAVVGKAPVMEARLIKRTGPESWEETCLFETDVPPLLNAEEPEKFVF